MSSPFILVPQPITLPADVTAKAWCSPIATWAIPEFVPLGMALSLYVVLSPHVTICPLLLSTGRGWVGAAITTVLVAVDVRVAVGVLVAVDVRVAVGVLVAVDVRVLVNDLVLVGVLLAVGVMVAVGA